MGGRWFAVSDMEPLLAGGNEYLEEPPCEEKAAAEADKCRKNKEECGEFFFQYPADDFKKNWELDKEAEVKCTTPGPEMKHYFNNQSYTFLIPILNCNKFDCKGREVNELFSSSFDCTEHQANEFKYTACDGKGELDVAASWKK